MGQLLTRLPHVRLCIALVCGPHSALHTGITVPCTDSTRPCCPQSAFALQGLSPDASSLVSV